MLELHDQNMTNVAIVKNVDEIPNFEAPEMTEEEFFAQIEEIEK